MVSRGALVAVIDGMGFKLVFFLSVSGMLATGIWFGFIMEGIVAEKFSWLSSIPFAFPVIITVVSMLAAHREHSRIDSRLADSAVPKFETISFRIAVAYCGALVVGLALGIFVRIPNTPQVLWVMPTIATAAVCSIALIATVWGILSVLRGVHPISASQ